MYKTQSYAQDLAILGVAIALFVVALIASGMEILHGWVGLLFIPIYFLGIVFTFITSIIIIVRKVRMKLLELFLPVCALFALSSVFVSGDNGDSSGTWFLGRLRDDAYMSKPIPQVLVALGYLGFFVFGITAMVMLVVFACGKRRTV
jgi:hypothetical protein